MLWVNAFASAQAAKDYFERGLTREDGRDSGQGKSATGYYTEIVGQWGGKTSEQLGLDGDITRDQFYRLTENQHPETGEKLTQRMKSNRTAGWDVTFDVPKSVSVLYEQTRDERVMDAFRSSVRDTMQEMESEAQTRVRQNGASHDRVTGNLAWGEFVHFTTRPLEDGKPDPHLHCHVFVMNSTWDSEHENRDGSLGAYKAVQMRNQFRDKGYYQAAFHARFAQKLGDIGVQVERTEHAFELAGIQDHPDWLQKFSRRTGQIEETIAELGLEHEADKRNVGRKTRKAKQDKLTRDQLQEYWDTKKSAEELKFYANVVPNNPPNGGSTGGGERDAMDFAIAHSFERESVVSEKQLMAEALKQGVGQVSVDRMKEELQREELVRERLADKWGQRKMVTTKAVLAEEQSMIETARQSRGRFASLGKPEFEFRQFSKGDGELIELNAGQKNAVQHILQSPDGVITVRGGAGVGKSTAMVEAVRGIRQGGKQVISVAPTTTARDNLNKDGLESETIARLLVDERLHARAKDNVILVDEAGQVGVQDMKKVLELAEKQNARVVLVGDTRQHHGVPRGDSLRILEQQAGIKPAEITSINRQKGAYKDAVYQISQGQVNDGFQKLDRMGWVQEVSGHERYRQLADEYLEATRRKKSNGDYKTAMVIAPTHREGELVTGVIRDTLKAEGRLSKEEQKFVRLKNLNWTEAQREQSDNYRAGHVVQLHQNLPGFTRGERLEVVDRKSNDAVTVRRSDGNTALLPLDRAKQFQVYETVRMKLAKGDRIRITNNGQTADQKHNLRNGSLYDVKGFTDSGDIRLKNGWTIDRDYGFLTHGYTRTSDSSQSHTVNETFVAQSSLSFGATSQKQLYVTVSRATDRCVIFTDDKQSLKQAIHRSGERLAASELVDQAQATKQQAATERQRQYVQRVRQFSQRARAYARDRMDRMKTAYENWRERHSRNTDRGQQWEPSR